eukprot:CAMPEP_0173423394 /NCGR_PEP_ID=MMETSP1357-20121228/3715_1 /TAXON_ID=77926 /ORGANISM="Hemiselmis rufescens, Strain PCC563" /LENGTH=115 /DNA_ID=CAMNT_0014386503 /DNA_START=34 /DNA_END=378 /DNA_ORIENTATION=+
MADGDDSSALDEVLGHVYTELADLEERSTSAPPVLELTAKTLFSYRPPLDDIRFDDQYEQFYEQSQDKDRLPPPLQMHEFKVGAGLEGSGKWGDPTSPGSSHLVEQAIELTQTPT